MTDMSEFGDDMFDVIVDKACMDAALAGAGDVWNPDPASINVAYKTLVEVSRVLRPGSVFIQISLDQPHFRKKYLLGQYPLEDDFFQKIMTSTSPGTCPFGWDCQVEQVGGGTNCFSHFMYIMTKRVEGKRQLQTAKE